MVTRYRVRNAALHGQVVVLRGGQAKADEQGLLPVDLSPEQLAHVKRGLGTTFDAVDVTTESVLREQLAACEAKLPEIAAGVEQAGKIFEQWHERHGRLMLEIEDLRRALAELEQANGQGPAPAVTQNAPPPEDKPPALEGLGGSSATEPPPPPPPEPQPLSALSWDDLKDLAKAHDISVGRRTREEIEQDLEAALAASVPKE